MPIYNLHSNIIKNLNSNEHLFYSYKVCSAKKINLENKLLHILNNKYLVKSKKNNKIKEYSYNENKKQYNNEIKQKINNLKNKVSCVFY